MELLKIQMDYMWFLLKRFKLIGIFFLCCTNGFAQPVVKNFAIDSVSQYFETKAYPIKKVIPIEFETQIKLALLYYPELNDIEIEFVIKNKISPLSAQPTIGSILRQSSKRKYKIFISNRTIEKLNPILLRNLNFNSQIGVLGHELSHIAEYNSKNGLFFIRLALRHLNKKSINRFEFNTDNRCIDHLLGFQLLSWSNEVRNKLGIKIWGGAKNDSQKTERYMNPETIINKIKQNKNYKI